MNRANYPLESFWKLRHKATELWLDSNRSNNYITSLSASSSFYDIASRSASAASEIFFTLPPLSALPLPHCRFRSITHIAVLSLFFSQFHLRLMTVLGVHARIYTRAWVWYLLLLILWIWLMMARDFSDWGRIFFVSEKKKENQKNKCKWDDKRPVM